MRARALLLLVALSAASWAFDETPTSAVPTATPTTLSQTLISVNKAPYQNNASAYYLGYHPADYEKPFAKYFNPHVAPISAEVEKGITMSPYAAALGEITYKVFRMDSCSIGFLTVNLSVRSS